MNLPTEFYNLLLPFARCFTQPTFNALLSLILGALLASKQRTITACIRAALPAFSKHFSTYHRVLSRAPWQMLVLSSLLLRTLLNSLPLNGPIYLVIDDTLSRHRGDKVFGKGCHRDASLSTKSRHVSTYGHRWIVLCVLVPMPFSRRPWALPFLCFLYTNPSAEHKCKRCKKARCAKRSHRTRDHRTPCDLARIMTRLVRYWAPNRRFVLVGDADYSSHDLARTCRGALTLISRAPKDMALYEPPPARGPGRSRVLGRPRVKGKKLASPLEASRNPETVWTTSELRWYGQSTTTVTWTSGEGYWYRQGEGLVWVRWVWSRSYDRKGKLREECFYTTDPTLTPEQILEAYADRWQIEVTFEEAREHLGLETTRNRTKNAVCRSFAGLLALYSLVSVWYREHGWATNEELAGAAEWYKKEVPSFRDALSCLRRQIWSPVIFGTGLLRAALSKITEPYQRLLLYHLTGA